MTITTLIGLTEKEYDRARADLEYEKFQLEEISRHYEARMRRRDVKRNIMRKLAFSTRPSADYEGWKRRWAKLEELDRHDARDRIRWNACMDRQIAIIRRWNEMVDERNAAKAASA